MRGGKTKGDGVLSQVPSWFLKGLFSFKRQEGMSDIRAVQSEIPLVWPSPRVAVSAFSAAQVGVALVSSLR